ncbi:MAG: hypothetical protein AAFV53_11545 [Myxococcota bacterium]
MKQQQRPTTQGSEQNTEASAPTAGGTMNAGMYPGNAAMQETIATNGGQSSPWGRRNSYSGRDTPSNSYNRGELKWEGGEEVTRAEYEAVMKKHGAAMAAGVGAMAGLIGIPMPGDAVAKMITEAEAQINAQISMCEGEIGWLESEIEYIEDKLGWTEDEDDLSPEDRKRLNELRARLANSEADLKKMKDGKKTALQKLTSSATEIVGKINDYVSKAAALGPVVADALPQQIDTSKFSGLSDAVGKLDKYVKMANVATTITDRRGLLAFQANPSFDTAVAWSQSVGGALASLTPLTEGLPLSWGTVLSGALKTPARVFEGFTGLMQRHRKALDDALHGYSNSTSRNLPEGTYG